MTNLVSDALLVLGGTVTVLATWAMVWTRPVYDRLHLLAPVSSLGVPLIAAGLAVRNGWGLVTAQLVVIAAIVALTGPAVGMATARVAAEREEGASTEEPE
jgi:multisubunit Na+/H+ antiporter MnhG subunit